jgi:hypothetical protein
VVEAVVVVDIMVGVEELGKITHLVLVEVVGVGFLVQQSSHQQQ